MSRARFGRATARPIVRRALASALVVGPVLIAINYGDAILRGDLSGGQLLKMALTLLVPYAVSTFSSVQAAAMPRKINEPTPSAGDSRASHAG